MRRCSPAPAIDRDEGSSGPHAAQLAGLGHVAEIVDMRRRQAILFCRMETFQQRRCDGQQDALGASGSGKTSGPPLRQDKLLAFGLRMRQHAVFFLGVGRLKRDRNSGLAPHLRIVLFDPCADPLMVRLVEVPQTAPSAGARAMPARRSRASSVRNTYQARLARCRYLLKLINVTPDALMWFIAAIPFPSFDINEWSCRFRMSFIARSKL